MSFDAARAVADAILYEGYVLYPYRVSSPKNRFRFQFGVLVPPVFAAAGFGDRASFVAEVPVAGLTTVRGRVRFLHLRRRAIERFVNDDFVPVDRLEIGDALYVTWDEAIEREIEFDGDRDFHIDGDERSELLFDGEVVVGRVRRTTQPLEGHIALNVGETVRVMVENRSAHDEAEDRERALPFSLIGAHVIVESDDADFISLVDPPAEHEPIAAACRSDGVFPVLITRKTVLASAVILYDFPAVAPESRHDFYDALEIDELLTLRTITLTEEEKREARATDALASAIVDRSEGIQPPEWDRLHGVTSVITRGARVRIRLGSRRTDAQDMFLDGLLSTVEEVRDDFDGQRWIGVTVEDDPGADLHREKGRRFWFHPEELEPVR